MRKPILHTKRFRGNYKVGWNLLISLWLEKHIKNTTPKLLSLIWPYIEISIFSCLQDFTKPSQCHNVHLFEIVGTKRATFRGKTRSEWLGIKKSKLVMLLRAKKGWPYLGMKVCNERSAAGADALEGFFSRCVYVCVTFWNTVEHTRLIILISNIYL